MPQDSISPDLPSVGDLAQEVEDLPIRDDIPIRRHILVENLLQDLLMAAQDFDGAANELAGEPIIQQEIFFPRPQRPAGRFMLGAGRRNPRPLPPPDPYHRLGVWGRQYMRRHFQENPRLAEVALRPAGLLGRPANPEGNFGEQDPFDIPGGPDDVDQGPPAIGDLEPDRQVAVEVEPHGPAAVDAEPGVQADADLEPGRYAAAEEEMGMQAVEGAEADMAEAANPAVAGNAAAAEAAVAESDMTEAATESDMVGDTAVKLEVTGNAEESYMEKTAEAESNMLAKYEPGLAVEAMEVDSDIAAEAESDTVAKAEPDMAAEAVEAESDMVAKAEPGIAAEAAEAESDMTENAEVDLGRLIDVKPETCSPVTAEESELVRTEMVEGQLDTPTTAGAETTKVLAKGAEAIGSAATSESTSMPVTIAHECPLPVKRARLHITEAVCSEQFEDDSNDKTAEESSKPKGED